MSRGPDVATAKVQLDHAALPRVRVRAIADEGPPPVLRDGHAGRREWNADLTPHVERPSVMAQHPPGLSGQVAHGVFVRRPSGEYRADRGLHHEEGLPVSH